jgi:hypothetical protein
MNIIIETIPHNRQEYPTCGDWRWKNEVLHIYVSKMGDWRYEMLVAFHELAEALICRHRGIPQKAVDEFDIAYEQKRQPGDESEPGDDLSAPYYHEHQFASCIELLLAGQLEVDPKTFSSAVGELF